MFRERLRRGSGAAEAFIIVAEPEGSRGFLNMSGMVPLGLLEGKSCFLREALVADVVTDGLEGL